MLSIPLLRRNQLYEFRAEQLRYCRESTFGINARFVFKDSRGRSKKLTQKQVQMEVFELQEFCEN